MNFWAHINGEDYPIAIGFTINDNFSETLDDCTIDLPHIMSKLDIKPFDDVIIHNYSEGLLNARDINGSPLVFHKKFIPANGGFFHHFLVKDPSKTQISIDEGYNYHLSLFSETKGLENVQMPNRSITQPRIQDTNEPPKSVYFFANSYVNLYSPRVKTLIYDSNGNPTGKWQYSAKYVLDSSIKDKFDSVKAPETYFEKGTLRDALTKLFNVLDCIPIVYNGVIFALDLSERNNLIPFVEGTEIPNIPGFSWKSWQMNAEEYSDRLRRDYTDALSKDSICRYVEKLGFRNMDTSAMKLSDLRVEFTHKIYHIDKFFMCYYKKTTDGRILLCRRDISKLILLNGTRNLLSVDWKGFQESVPSTIDGYYDKDGNYVNGYADYRFCTLGYDIGSTAISGWGEFVNYSNEGVFNNKKSYLENIIGICESISELGSRSDVYDYFKENSVINLSPNSVYILRNSMELVGDPTKSMISPASASNGTDWWWEATSNIGNWVSGFFTVSSVNMKTVFFEVEYEGFIDSAVQFSKDYHDGDVVKNDNVSGAYNLVEYDGLMEKEKANKLGNETVVTDSRVYDDKFSEVCNLADYDSNDFVIYRKSTTFENDYSHVVYYQCKDYVLKNYFTSVFNRYRPFKLASREEALMRKESHVEELLFSKTKSYFQTNSFQFVFLPSIDSIVSFHKESNVDSTSVYSYSEDEIDSSYIIHNPSVDLTVPSYGALTGLAIVKDGYKVKVISDETHDGSQQIYKYDKAENVWVLVPHIFAVDTQGYVAGSSICFTVQMIDNESAGVYIKQLNPDFGNWIKSFFNANYDTTNYALYSKKDTPLDDIIGSMQDWYLINDDSESGYIGSISFVASAKSRSHEKEIYLDEITGVLNSDDLARNQNKIRNDIYPNYILPLPSINYKPAFESNDIPFFSVIESDKDAKELISSTMQIEPISDTVDISFSPWIMKLSDLNCRHNKKWKDYVTEDNKSIIIYATTVIGGTQITYAMPTIAICLPDTTNFDSLNSLYDTSTPKQINETLHWEENHFDFISGLSAGFVQKVSITIKYIKRSSYDKLVVACHINVISPTAEGNGSAIEFDYDQDIDFLNPESNVNKDFFTSITTLDAYGQSGTVDITKVTDPYGEVIRPYIKPKIGNHINYCFCMTTFKTIEKNVNYYDPSNPQTKGIYSTSNNVFYGGLIDQYDTSKICSLVKTGDWIDDVDGTNSKTNTKNLFSYVTKETLKIKQTYDQFGEKPSEFEQVEKDSYFFISISRDSKGNVMTLSAIPSDSMKQYILSNSSSKNALGSIRVYFYNSDDAYYHFVYGENFYFSDYDATNNEIVVKAYISLTDDRSKSVVDSHGEPTYRVANYVSDSDYSYGTDNYCLPK